MPSCWSLDRWSEGGGRSAERPERAPMDVGQVVRWESPGCAGAVRAGRCYREPCQLALLPLEHSAPGSSCDLEGNRS